ncbi:hypothetical protein ACH427_04555 [Streptomyces sp. NPDC020379]|uniref:hypothetical protein n=1 Tax=Streptomyces sp. NPDC020379 TaxID=3365071 RepID=UPI00379065DF
MSRYPEHDKLDQIKELSHEIYEFISWMEDRTDFRLCREVRLDDRDMDDPTVYVPPGDSAVSKLLAQYFGIDMEKLTAEKEHMLQQHRDSQEEQ